MIKIIFILMFIFVNFNTIYAQVAGDNTGNTVALDFKPLQSQQSGDLFPALILRASLGVSGQQQKDNNNYVVMLIFSTRGSVAKSEQLFSDVHFLPFEFDAKMGSSNGLSNADLGVAKFNFIDTGLNLTLPTYRHLEVGQYRDITFNGSNVLRLTHEIVSDDGAIVFAYSLGVGIGVFHKTKTFNLIHNDGDLEGASAPIKGKAISTTDASISLMFKMLEGKIKLALGAGTEFMGEYQNFSDHYLWKTSGGLNLMLFPVKFVPDKADTKAAKIFLNASFSTALNQFSLSDDEKESIIEYLGTIGFGYQR